MLRTIAHPAVEYDAPPKHLGKRALDISFGLVALLAVTPLLLVLMVVIVLDSPGWPVFVQERVGFNGQRFKMLKLRTMTRDADAMRDSILHLNESDGPLFKCKCDPRVTRVGRILRTTSLDELPQLVNVIRGEMSLVGPRPCLPTEVLGYTPSQARRLSAVPGLTGLWQVSGRAQTTFEEYVAFDLEYIDRWSFWLDVSLIVRTIWVVALFRGAY